MTYKLTPVKPLKTDAENDGQVFFFSPPDGGEYSETHFVEGTMMSLRLTSRKGIYTMSPPESFRGVALPISQEDFDEVAPCFNKSSYKKVYQVLHLPGNEDLLGGFVVVSEERL